MPNPTEAFESWLLGRVAQAVEAGKVSADLLAELRAGMEAARERPQEEGHALAVQDIAERLGLPVDQAEMMLCALQSQLPVTQELLLRGIVEVWLTGQRKAYGASEQAKEPDGDQRKIARLGEGCGPACFPPRIPSPLPGRGRHRPGPAERRAPRLGAGAGKEDT